MTCEFEKTRCSACSSTPSSQLFVYIYLFSFYVNILFLRFIFSLVEVVLPGHSQAAQGPLCQTALWGKLQKLILYFGEPWGYIGS